MKRKYTLPFILISIVSMASCGNNNSSTPINSQESGSTETHTHTYDASTWESNSTYHWHPTTCGHDEALVKEEHVFTEKDGNSVCVVCGYTISSKMNDYFKTWRDGIESTLNYTGDYTAEYNSTYKKSNSDDGVSITTEHVKEAISTNGLFARLDEYKEDDEEMIYVSSVRKYNDTNYIWSEYDSTESNIESAASYSEYSEEEDDESYSIICDETYANDYIRDDAMYLSLEVYGVNGFMLYADDFSQCAEICLDSNMYYYMLNDGPKITDYSVTINEDNGAIKLTSTYSYLYFYYSSSRTIYQDCTVSESLTVKDGKISEQDYTFVSSNNVNNTITNYEDYYKITYNYNFDNDFANECNDKVVDKITDKSNRVYAKLYLPDGSYIWDTANSYNEPAPSTTYGFYELYYDKELTNKYEGQPLTKSITKFYLKAVPTENMVIFSEQETRKYNYPELIPEFLRIQDYVYQDYYCFQSVDDAKNYLSSQSTISNYSFTIDGEEYTSDTVIELGKMYQIVSSVSYPNYNSSLKEPTYPYFSD